MKVIIPTLNGSTEWPSVTAWLQDIVLCQLLHRHEFAPPERDDLTPYCLRCGTAGLKLS